MAFHAALRSAHVNFVAKLEAQARTLLQHHLDTATSEFALSMMASMPDVTYAQPAAPSRRAAAAALADDAENVPPEEAGGDEQVLQVLKQATSGCAVLLSYDTHHQWAMVDLQQIAAGFGRVPHHCGQ